MLFSFLSLNLIYGNNSNSSENEAQLKALQIILDGFKVPYENEPSSDATEYLLSTKAPEALKYDYTGWYSRRINEEHRLVYRLEEGKIIIAQMRFHY